MDKFESCIHESTRISEPHLAGARECNNCNGYYNPNLGGWVKRIKSKSIDKYQKLNNLGLKVYPISDSHVVLAEDVLELFDAGVEVYSYSGNSTWTRESYSSDTHTGIVINIKELKPKQVTITREDLFNAFDSEGYDPTDSHLPRRLAEKLGL